jgi:glycosyltransferase involved in cell wall biosynthesis
MTKLKVLQIIDSLNVGGTEVLAVNIANSLTEYRIVSHLCCTREEGELKEKLDRKVGYLYLNKKSILDLKSLFKLKKYVVDNKINIIHAHSTSLFFSFCLKFLNPNIKLIWHNHTGTNYHLKGLNFRVIKFLSRFSNAIINVSKELDFWTKEKLKHKNTVKLNNFPRFTNSEKTTKLKGDNGKRIVILAGLRVEKDHLTLLKSFREVYKLNTDWTLHLIGKDYLNKYSNKIKNFITEENLSNAVYMYDMCSDIKNILQQATIGVLSSKSEGLPIALLEYGLAKLPVIVTDVGECNTVIINNISGFLVKPNNTEKFVSKLNILANSEALRNSFGTEHYNNVKQNYSKELFINNLLAVYNSTFD